MAFILSHYYFRCFSRSLQFVGSAFFSSLPLYLSLILWLLSARAQAHAASYTVAVCGIEQKHHIVQFHMLIPRIHFIVGHIMQRRQSCYVVWLPNKLATLNQTSSNKQSSVRYSLHLLHNGLLLFVNVVIIPNTESTNKIYWKKFDFFRWHLCRMVI